MEPKIIEALQLASQEIDQIAQREESDDAELATSLRAVGDMLEHLSRSSSSPLFRDLKHRISESGGDGRQRQLKEVATAVAALLIAHCGLRQNEAVRATIEICGGQSRSSLQRALGGARDPETIRKIDNWPVIERRIEQAKRRAKIQQSLSPQIDEPDWRVAVLDILAGEAAQLSV